MPQATDEIREQWGGENGVGDEKAIDHLMKKGFTFTRGGMIVAPKDFDFKADTEDTLGAIQFLCDEWDYGFDPNIKGDH